MRRLETIFSSEVEGISVVQGKYRVLSLESESKKPKTPPLGKQPSQITKPIPQRKSTLPKP
jgi:hypothetical protein